MLANVGSVGLPRDGDPRACYVLLEGRSLHFRRVPYDLAPLLQRLRRAPLSSSCLAWLSRRHREGA
ncbi:MAG: hypothetical protein HYZ53_21010 [Planctomycetes bacterium]|nr:hypothetical protein [Planctomycetota bacterium]